MVIFFVLGVIIKLKNPLLKGIVFHAFEIVLKHQNVFCDQNYVEHTRVNPEIWNGLKNIVCQISIFICLLQEI